LTQSPTKHISIPTDIEDEATANNITLFFNGSIESKFSSSVRWGGAGGMGAATDTVYSPDEFFNRFRAYGCLAIEIEMLNGDVVKKRYSSFIPNTSAILEYTVTVPTPDGFSLKRFTYEDAFYKQKPAYLLLMAIFLVTFLAWGYLCLRL